MKKNSRLLVLFSLCLVCVMMLSGCNGDDNSSPTGPGTVLLEQDVTVPGGGGVSGEVTFSASSGLTIRITLTASNTMQPFGYLTFPNGQGGYYPANETAQNGMNTVDLLLTQGGTYRLTVMDGTNIGGTVHVKVEVI